MNTIVLKGTLCYSDREATLHSRKNAYLVCKDGISLGVFDTLPEEYTEAPLYDFGEKLILPGMVDLHIHAPQYSYRGLGMDRELIRWLNDYTFPEESKFSSLAYAKEAYDLFADGMRRSATTRACIFATVHRAATEYLMDAMENSGLVTYVGKVNMDRNAPAPLCEESAEVSARETVAWLDAVAGRYQRTLPILTPRFIPSCSDPLMEELGRIRARYGLPVQSHLSENLKEIAWVRELVPTAAHYGDAYDRFGLFGREAKTVMAHCVWSPDEEIDRMAQNGVFVAHAPASNLNLASGIAPIRKLLSRGVAVGLATDVAGGHSESMFRAITDAIQVSKMYWRYVDQGATPLTFAEAFYLATAGGGAFFGKVGSFEAGYEVDAIVLDDTTHPTPLPLSPDARLERAVYLGLDATSIVAKFVQGRRVG